MSPARIPRNFLPVFVVGTSIGVIPGALVFASVGTGLGGILASGGSPDGAAMLQPHIVLPILGLAVLALIPAIVKRFRRGRFEGSRSDE